MAVSLRFRPFAVLKLESLLASRIGAISLNIFVSIVSSGDGSAEEILILVLAGVFEPLPFDESVDAIGSMIEPTGGAIVLLIVEARDGRMI